MNGRRRSFPFLIASVAMMLLAGIVPSTTFSHGNNSGHDDTRRDPPASSSSSDSSSSSRSSAPDRSFGSWSGGHSDAPSDPSWGRSSDSSSSTWDRSRTENSNGPSGSPPGSGSNLADGYAGNGPLGSEVKDKGIVSTPTDPIPSQAEIPPSTVLSAPQTKPFSVVKSPGVLPQAPPAGLPLSVPPPPVARHLGYHVDQNLRSRFSASERHSGSNEVSEFLTAPNIVSKHAAWEAAPSATAAYSPRGLTVSGGAPRFSVPFVFLPIQSTVVSIQNGSNPTGLDDEVVSTPGDKKKPFFVPAHHDEEARWGPWAEGKPSFIQAHRHGHPPDNNPHPVLPGRRQPIASGGNGHKGGPKPTPAAKIRTVSYQRRPELIPYRRIVYLIFSRGQREASANLLPPPGKRLVIASYSVVNCLPSRQPVHVSFLPFVPESDRHGLTPSSTIDPGSYLTIYGIRNDTAGSGSVLVYVYGFLSPVPREDDLP